MTVHLTDAQEHQLNEVAAQSGLSVDEHAQRAVEQYLLWRKDFVAAVQDGLAAADRGELVEHKEVVAMLDDILANR